MKTSVLVPPPGVFTRPDLYGRCYHQRVQHLAKEFGVNGGKSFLSACKRETNGVRSPEILRLVILCYLKKCHLGISGQWLE